MEVEVMAGEETFVWKESSGGLLKEEDGTIFFSYPKRRKGKVGVKGEAKSMDM